jgi:anti-sigma B factor antagonist
METPDFHIDVRDEGSLLVLGLRGELDLLTVAAVREAIAQHGAGRQAMVLDLSGLEFMDSTGIRLLLELWQRRDGTAVAFVAATGAVARVLDLCGLTPLVTWVDDPAEALGDIAQ